MNPCGFFVRTAFGLASLLVSVVAAQSQYNPVAESADLRAYGKVEATLNPERTVFQCQDERHADILLGKLLADLFWDAKADHVQHRVELKGKPIVVHEWQPFGAMLAARNGKQVVILGGENTAAVVAMAEQEKNLAGDEVRFQPEHPYPVYLDLYDLRAFKSYVSPMVFKEGLEDHWDFIKRFGLGGVSFKAPSIQNSGRAVPGVVQFTSEDYERQEAEKNNGLFIPCPGVSGQAPFWMHNLVPNEMMLPSPTSVIGAWGGAGCSGGAYSSWGMSLQTRMKSFFIYQRQVMEEFLGSPALGGWHFYGGSPGNESTFHDRTCIFWDYSPAGQRLFRHYLREVKGYDLKALSQRWYGVPDRFKSWDDVSLPDVHEFFGDLNESCLLLNREPWRWKSAVAKSDAAPEPDATWIPVELAPSQKQNFLPWGAASYAVEFDATAWLKKNTGKDVFAVCAVYVRSNEGTRVWLNDQYQGNLKPENPSQPGAFAFKATGLVRPGKNRLILSVPSGARGVNFEGKILGPVFLTTAPPENYPFSDPGKNARYIDLKLGQRYGNYYAQLDMFNLARALDPDRPFLFSSHGDSDITELAATYAAALQNTGRESYYFPWNTGLGPVIGVYGVSEEAATAQTPALTREFGWMMMDADSHHDLYHNLDPYIQEEQATGWFTRNKRYIELYGKYLRVPAPVVLFRSSLTQFMGSTMPAAWDIGRGELQTAHYDNFYATEREVEKGLINPYPILFDAGTEYMEPSTVQAIQRYVEQGGTFVALHATGRHGLERANNWPISELTGFKVVGTGKTGSIRFEDNAPLLKAWAGQQIGGEGDAQDFQKKQTAKAVGLALQAAAPDTQVIARWVDGSVAVGMRQIGKGRVIVLGSTFWRSGRDVGGVWASGATVAREFFNSLFTDLGITRDADASDPAIWARKMVTKNGLEEWVVAFNSDAAKEHRVAVSLRTPRKPVQVLDMASRKSVPFTYVDGMVKVEDVQLDPNGIRIFGLQRATLAGGLTTWWGEKTKYWSACNVDLAPIKKILASTTVQQGAAIAIDRWRFRAVERDGAVDDRAWMEASFDDQAWRTIKTGAWNLLVPDLKDYQGVGLYRSEFTVPEKWAGRTIMLGLYSFNNPIVYDEGEFFINGHPVATYKARTWNQTLNYAITEHLKPGKNVLAVKVKGGMKFSGIGGAVWIDAEQKLSGIIDLADDWQVVLKDYLQTKPFTAPGTVKGKYLTRTVALPADWRGKPVYLHVETDQQWFGCVVINGQPINYSPFLHPFGLRTEINLEPYFKAGETNTLELWPYKTIPGHGEAEIPEDVQMDVKKLFIGCGSDAR